MKPNWEWNENKTIQKCYKCHDKTGKTDKSREIYCWRIKWSNGNYADSGITVIRDGISNDFYYKSKNEKLLCGKRVFKQ